MCEELDHGNPDDVVVIRDSVQVEKCVGSFPSTPTLEDHQSGSKPVPDSDYETGSSNSSSCSVRSFKTPKDKADCCCCCCPNISGWNVKKAMKVKAKFVPAKLTYFVFFAARSIFYANYMIFLTSVGLDPRQAGLIQGIRLIIVTLSASLWGYVADRSQRHVLIIIVQVAFATAFVFIMPFVPIILRESAEEHIRHTAGIQNATVPNLLTEQLNSTLVQNLSSAGTVHYESGTTTMFLIMLALGLGSAFFGGGTQVLIDTLILTFTKKVSGSKNAFGRQRLWGSVAYAITPVVTGAITEACQYEASPYLPVFCIFTALKLGLIISCIFLLRRGYTTYVQSPTESTKTLNEAPTTDNIAVESAAVKAESQRKQLWVSLKKPNVLAFLFIVFLLGFGNGIQWHFIFLMMEELGSSRVLMGLIVLVQCFVEIIILPSASKVSSLFRSNKWTMVAGVTGYGAAFSGYYFLNDPRWILMVSAVIGLSFSIFYTAAMDELYSISSSDTVTTYLGIYNAIYSGVGSAVAGVIGGIVYKALGFRLLFLSASCFHLVCAGMLVVWYLFDSHRKGKEEKAKQNLRVLAEKRKSSPELLYADVISVSMMSVSVIDFEDMTDDDCQPSPLV